LVDASKDPVTSEILLALQLRTANEPLLPRLDCFECEQAGESFIPFIPLFLSPQTVYIDIAFAEGAPVMSVASIINRFPTLCHDLETIIIKYLVRDSVIIDAVLEMLLVCNQDSL